MLTKCDVYFDWSESRVLVEITEDMLYDVNKQEYLSVEESEELLKEYNR